MKLFVGAVTMLTALVISGVAGFFSVIGLGHLFAGAFWPVVVMGSALEIGKLVTASWLKANWNNPAVDRKHRFSLLAQVVVLMLITSLGVYGYLAKGHLEQEASLPAVTLKIAQGESRVRQITEERARLEERLAGLDRVANAMLSNARTSKEAQAADRARRGQRKDRIDLAKQIAGKDAEINTLNDGLVPLRLQVSDVSAKLGPVKYVAQLFGWQDPNSAVQMVILMIMFAFDPLAVLLVLAGTLTLGEWLRERHARNRHGSLKNVPITDMADHLDRQVSRVEDFDGRAETRGTLVTELPKGENLPVLSDLDFFRNKMEQGLRIPPEYLPRAAADSETPAPPFVGAAPVEPENAVATPLADTASIGAAASNVVSANVATAPPQIAQDAPGTPVVHESGSTTHADQMAALRTILENKRFERVQNDAAIIALSEVHDETVMETLADTIAHGMDLTAEIAQLEQALSDAPIAVTPYRAGVTGRLADTAWGSLGGSPKASSHPMDLSHLPETIVRREESAMKSPRSFPGTISSSYEPVGILPEILTLPSNNDDNQAASMDFHSFSESMFSTRTK